jgi:hypothetical protein
MSTKDFRTQLLKYTTINYGLSENKRSDPLKKRSDGLRKTMAIIRTATEEEHYNQCNRNPLPCAFHREQEKG